jgi:hypothetical protein
VQGAGDETGMKWSNIAISRAGKLAGLARLQMFLRVVKLDFTIVKARQELTSSGFTGLVTAGIESFSLKNMASLPS